MAQLHQTRILIVEDDEEVGKALRARLAREGCETCFAKDDSAALELLRDPATGHLREDHGIDLVLLDNVTPDASGVELLRELRRETTRIDLPVIIVTDDHHPREVVYGLKSGANDYVAKPIDFDVLLVRIVTHLELRNSHRSLRDSHAALVRAARMESTMKLAAGMAHEIRNPLAQIQMCLDGIRPAIPESETVAREMCGMMGDAVVLAETIVSALIGQADAESIHLCMGDINGFLRDVLRDMEILFVAAKAELSFALDDADPTALFASEELRQVIVNVVSNALEAMPDGGAITIRTGLRTPEDLPRNEGSRLGARVRNGEPAAFIEVEDTGHGIAEEELTKAFDPFSTNRATGPTSGKGLGLTVARQLINLQGGHIDLENRGRSPGARVTILLRHRETGLL